MSIQEYKNIARLKEKGTFRILCLGESTTAVIGGKGDYPTQLQEILNQQDIGITFSVLNKGMVGEKTDTLLLRLEDSLNKYRPQMVISMMGVNDDLALKPYPDSTIGIKESFFSKSRIYKLIALLRLHILNKLKEPDLYRLKKDKAIEDSDQPDQGVSRARPEDILKKALNKGLNKPRDYHDLGTIYHRQAEYAMAEAMFKKAIELAPQDYRAYLQLGILYHELKKFKQAEDYIKQSIEINPDNDAGIYSALGWLYGDLGKSEEALELFKKAIEIEPDNSQAYFNLAWFYHREGMLSQAVGIAKEALKVNPQWWDLYYELGCYYTELKKYRLAEEAFKKVIDFDPLSDKAYRGLALVYNLEGKAKLAQQYFKITNELGLQYYSPQTRSSYIKLKEILGQRGIQLVCVQYPMRSIEPLKKLFPDKAGIIFVDNEKTFKDAVRREGYDEYFNDNFAGDFGHCTFKGNLLLAHNIAEKILKDHFKINKLKE